MSTTSINVLFKALLVIGENVLLGKKLTLLLTYILELIVIQSKTNLGK
jgi:hypothetical protein